jgi:hypothetical protein
MIAALIASGPTVPADWHRAAMVWNPEPLEPGTLPRRLIRVPSPVNSISAMATLADFLSRHDRSHWSA